jgi:SET domain-containing protein
MDYESDSIKIIAVQDILKGEELFINYNGAWNDDTPIWFDVY